MFLQLKNKTPTFVILLKEDSSAHSFSSCQHCHGLQGRHSTSFFSQVYWKEIYKTTDLDPKQFSRSTNRQTQWVRRDFAIRILRRTQNRRELYKRLLKEGGDRGQGTDGADHAAKWRAFLFHIRDKTSVYLVVGIRTPDALVGRAFKLIRLTMISWLIYQTLYLFVDEFEDFWDCCLTCRSLFIYLFFHWLCKVPCFLSSFWVFKNLLSWHTEPITLIHNW